jgi:hypothetical protein
MPTSSLSSRTPIAVPVEYSGKWIAWSSDHSQIVAHSDTLPQLWELVRLRSIADPIFEKVAVASQVSSANDK